MSLNNGFINSTIICNEKKEVDLDALNFLASGEVVQLCHCAYKNESKHHHFIYDTNGLIPLTQLQAGLSFENVIDILSSAVDMMQTLAENNLLLDNVKNAKEYIPEVKLSLVDVVGEEEIKKAKELSESLGVDLRVRAYIS